MLQFHDCSSSCSVPDQDEDRQMPVFTLSSPLATRLSSPFHLNLVVVGTALFVIDFDDGCVVVRWVRLLHNRHLATAISLSHGYRHIGSWQRAGKIDLLVDSRCPIPLSRSNSIALNSQLDVTVHSTSPGHP